VIGTEETIRKKKRGSPKRIEKGPPHGRGMETLSGLFAVGGGERLRKLIDTYVCRNNKRLIIQMRGKLLLTKGQNGNNLKAQVLAVRCDKFGGRPLSKGKGKKGRKRPGRGRVRSWPTPGKLYGT